MVRGLGPGLSLCCHGADRFRFRQTAVPRPAAVHRPAPTRTDPGLRVDLWRHNPPLLAWAAWQIYQIDRMHNGIGDRDFLVQAYRSATLNTMWWLNQKDASDRGVFGGGFLGMDNIGCSTGTSRCRRAVNSPRWTALRGWRR